MRYQIIKASADYPGVIEINQEEYKSIINARAKLFEFLFIEEKFDLIIENYYEYETELLAIASRMMIYHDNNYFSMSKERNLIVRRIINLMTACKMYQDSIIHHLKEIYGNEPLKVEVIEKEKISQYESRIGYRVIESLRNHVQHRGFPIHSIKLSYERVPSEEDFRLLHFAIPLLNVNSLIEDGEFKASVLNELKTYKTKDGIDLRSFIRDYIEGIGKVHEKVREIVSADLIHWKEIIHDTLVRYQNEFGKDEHITLVTVIEVDADDHWSRKNIIFEDFVIRIDDYQKKNGSLINLKKCYASNEIRAGFS